MRTGSLGKTMHTLVNYYLSVAYYNFFFFFLSFIHFLIC